ncbi:hypothetical protein C4D60_Mb08t30620 [Musa balbisiana]|uniref:AB hydrolase-1 domain-containing protein n=1 Tax=Musa balbisiana TaxID=52838 RepID=A0A4S8K7P9_MUSBA|nr:hypothetical protein C4D60_Mb08t30620 [Musa balbisiana]
MFYGNTPPHLYKYKKRPPPNPQGIQIEEAERERETEREMGLSLVWLMDVFVRRAYTAAGLRSHTVAVDADTTVHCWISTSLVPTPSSAGADPGRGSRRQPKPPLLLVHGFGPRATWQWRSQIAALAARFDLIVPDLLFFGGSTTRSPQRSEAFQAAALARLLDALGVAPPRRARVSVMGTSYGGFVAYHMARAMGPDRVERAALARLLDALGVAPPRRARVSVMGTSYGGFVAYHMARAMGPDRVERVVIASSDLLKGPEDDKALLERAGGGGGVADLLLPRTTADMRRLVSVAVHHPPRFIPEFILRDMLRNLFSDKLEEKLELVKGISLANKDQFQLTPLPQQVLMIWGEDDQIFPVNKAFEMQKRLGENARLEVVQKTGHMPQMEDAGRFNKVVLGFLLGAP